MSSYNRPIEDIDNFIDFDGGFDNSNYADESHPYSGPSHQYDRFRQQTGLPTGAMSNISTYNDMNIDTDFASPSDFGRSASDMSAYGNGMNFDMDFNQTPQSATYPSFYPPSSNMDDFIHPSAVYETPRPVRMYPGMHTQQAEQKAAAMAKQQSQQSQPQHMTHQSSLEQHYSGKGKARVGSQSAVDPVADRRISEILDNMRHRSAMSPIDENGDSGDMDKAKKEDEEMDEDERLLASEEGKKLSSKERRQLRNKVSARAFRSRRKEYIGQLEGDLANKATEANDLRAFNRKLLDENNQLKNLTRTLLSHPAFHTFLEDMSRNQTFVAGPAPQHLHMPTAADNMQTQPQNEIKQEPESQSQQQQQQQSQQQDQLQVNMARLPENSLDMSMLNLGNNHWANGQSGGFNFSQPQVFAVFEVPQPSMEELRRSLPTLEMTTEPANVRVAEAPVARLDACRLASPAKRSPMDFSIAALNAQVERALATSRSIDLDSCGLPSPLDAPASRRRPLIADPVPGR